MKIIRKSLANSKSRSDGRTVTTLSEISLNHNISSLVLYHCDVPNGKFTAHLHKESHEIILFPVGGKMIVNGNKYEFGAWDGVFLEPGDIHGYDHDDCNDIVHLAIRMPNIVDKREVDV